ncbi:MAG: hypothetical protein NTY53_19330 [Kiritimatiellaeota bacterium]|nr:hypothetical protein [Kiritimatiellota bacterium]
MLISGRWFRAASFDGPWEFVPGAALPKDFAAIPDDSPQENVKAAGGEREGVDRITVFLEEHDLGEGLAGFDDLDDDLCAVGRGLKELNVAACEQEQTFAAVAFAEQQLAFAQFARAADGGKRGTALRREALEKSGLREDGVVIEFHGLIFVAERKAPFLDASQGFMA